jgi:hypothetical protein
MFVHSREETAKAAHAILPLICVRRRRKLILENGSNIRIVALSASLGNAKDLGECRDCLGKTAADLKLLYKGEIIII